MSKLVKRLSSMAATLLCATMLFTGCGQNSSKNEQGSSASTSSTPAASTVETVKGWVNPAETVTVKWKLIGSAQKDMKVILDEINKKLIPKYNIALDMEIIDWGTYNESIGLSISSQEEFDVCFTTAEWVNNFLPNVAKGAFVPLDELIDTYAPELRTSLPAFVLDGARVEGKIYAVPNYQNMAETWGVMIQKQFIDKYKVDVNSLKKLTDVEPLLKQIKDNEKNIFPINKVYAQSRDLVLYDGVAPYASIKLDDPQFTITLDSELAKQDAALANDWYKKGFIRKDAYTANEDTDIKTGKYALVCAPIKPGGDTEFSKNNGAEYVGVVFGKPFIKNGAARSTMNAISASSKHPEAAIKMIEILNTDKEIFNMLNFGIEGKNYELVNGFVKQIPDSGYFFNQAWAFGNQFNALYMEGQQQGTWEATDKLNKEALVSPITGFSIQLDPLSTYMARFQAIQDEYRNVEYTSDFEKVYDEYTKKIEAAGLAEYHKLVQAQLDEWLKANGKK